MNTPRVWTLNFEGEAWLAEEEARWAKIVASASGQDKRDAQAYLDTVRSELAQRRAQYAGGTWGAAKAGFGALFEALGGSAGDGAPGLSAAVSDGAVSAGKAVIGGLQSVAIVAVIAAAGFVYYKTRGKK